MAQSKQVKTSATQMLKKLKAEQKKLAKFRDSFRDIQDELEMQLSDCDEAYELLEACIDKLSELV